MKKLLASTIVCSALIIGTLDSAVAANKITIKFSHVVAENTPKGKMANRFKSLLEQRVGERVEVDIYPNSQLFGDNKVLQAMLLGDVQIAAPTLSKFSRYTKKLQLFDLPFLFKDMEAVERFQSSDQGRSLLKSMERKGLIGLGYLHNGMKQLSANDPLRIPQDANGKKFRIMSSDVLQAQFEAVKAVPLKKPFSEVFTLLQTKAIDGQENTWSNIYSKKFHEVQPYITESNHGLVDYMVVTSVEFWQQLDNELRREIKQAMDEAIQFGNQVALEKSVSDRQAILDSKRSELITITDSQRQLWIDAVQPVWKQFESQIGNALIEAAVQSNTP
ncbi:TRAP transporter substrate-binding protein [Motiliproteus sp. MSK22-1]|uniref:TRAP transporter substrate-binding protein n=1 Tax=Motiliproteus sp. MSK22-1 TaxID=1897630 RepID=UPI000975503B|nr:TRAP transporter substrate-binding protein [Motiliproteus sp. MSK22-1]OMH38886.1 C4-dicarboxylate ABC transporter [Motiliproteus sp. MSK22-1]